MRVAVAGDHAGLSAKEELLAHLEALGHEVQHLGAFQYDPEDDYPDYAKAVASAVATGQADRGIVVCGSGVGACVAANKVLGVRAAICHDTYSAHQGVEHDDMNVLCLGGRIVGAEVAKELAESFLNASFSGEERHVRRLNKLKAMEAEAFNRPS